MDEARKIEFDCDVVAMVYNAFYDTDGNTDLIMEMDGIPCPLIKVNIRKSKEGGAGPLYFALNSNTFGLKDFTIEEVSRLRTPDNEMVMSIGTALPAPEQLLGDAVVPRQQEWN